MILAMDPDPESDIQFFFQELHFPPFGDIESSLGSSKKSGIIASLSE